MYDASPDGQLWTIICLQTKVYGDISGAAFILGKKDYGSLLKARTENGLMLYEIVIHTFALCLDSLVFT